MAEVPDQPGSPIHLVTGHDGRFKDVELTRSYLIDRVFTGAVQWSAPVVIHGDNLDDDLALLNSRSVRGQSFVSIRDLPPFLRSMKWQDRFAELALLLDLRNFRNLRVAGRSAQRAEDLVSSGKDLEQIIAIVRDGPRGERRGGHSAQQVSDFIVELDKYCSTSPLVVTWPTRFNLFPAFLVAVWARRPRPYPLVIAAPRSLSFGDESWPNVRASVLEFSDLTTEIERVFGVERSEVEKAYWVWQLSRGEVIEKHLATTPKTISINNAREFIRVLTKSRPNELKARRLEQRAAPLMFDLGENVVELRHGHAPTDTPTIVTAAAQSFNRQLERVRNDGSIENIVPSSRAVFDVVGQCLSRVISGDYDDGDIITVGIEMNSFQFQVETVRHHIGEGAMGEIIGIFATSELFLRRFGIWREYSGVQKASGSAGDGLAQFRIARELLVRAKPAAILSTEAAQRVDVVLSRAPADNSPAELREGLVRSGENLAAITVNAASEIVAKEASALGTELKEKVRDEAASAIVRYAVKNADNIAQLAKLQNWRWAAWVYDLLKALGLGE